MRRVLAIGILGVALGARPAGAGDDFLGTLVDDVRRDAIAFYEAEDLGLLALGLVGAGALANSTADEDIQEWYQEDIHSSGTDDAAVVVKVFGDGLVTVPIFAAAWATGYLGENRGALGDVGEWGERSMRSIVVGAPTLLVLQRALGGSRPVEENGSTWRPFEDSNGVSGHSFMGAIPFLTAATMTDDIALKSVLYLGSTLCGLSRINDDAHYFSQSLLGWWIAFLAVEAVDEVEDGKDRRLHVGPIVVEDGVGLGLTGTF
jgi:hypothetical protein